LGEGGTDGEDGRGGANISDGGGTGIEKTRWGNRTKKGKKRGHQAELKENQRKEGKDFVTGERKAPGVQGTHMRGKLAKTNLGGEGAKTRDGGSKSQGGTEQGSKSSKKAIDRELLEPGEQGRDS